VTTTAILTIGSELLCGDGLDTNSAWLSRRLEAIGCAVRLHLSCLDVMEDIVRGLEVAAELAEVVIVTGGLGPTVDDLTRAAVARYLDEPLVLDEGELAHIEALFARFSRTMSPNNRAQAERPQSARRSASSLALPPLAASSSDVPAGAVTACDRATPPAAPITSSSSSRRRRATW